MLLGRTRVRKTSSPNSCYENKSSLSCSCFDRYLIAETSQLPRETLRFAKAFRLRQWRADWLLIRLSALENNENRA